MRRKEIHKPDHPNAYKNGNILEYVYIASKKLNRPLLKGEIVHHIDENPFNNDEDNLMVFATKSDHNKFHANGLDFNIVEKLNNGSYKIKDDVILISSKEFICEYCHKRFIAEKINHKKNKIYCSIECSNKDKEKFDISIEQLKELVKIYNLTKIGKMFGVSDNAIRKRCIKNNIDFRSKKKF